MTGIQDHPLRYALTNELHARPFPALECPSYAAYLAIKQPENAVGRDRAADLAHLLDLLDRFGAEHPRPGATHFYGQLGKHFLKWESHSEFVTYTIFVTGTPDHAFDPANFAVFPADWLTQIPGTRLTSALINIAERPKDAIIRENMKDWFVAESVAAVEVLDKAAIVAGDFRIDAGGHLRFAVFTAPGITPRRIGRIVQRLSEIETYKAMAMLAQARMRDISARMQAVDAELSALVQGLGGNAARADADLSALLEHSGALEGLMAETSFRFGATRAYEAIVHDRVTVMREERFDGRQTLNEFMMRRFDPAMRSVRATERQLASLAARAERAGNLLRTRVDVERSAQNQHVLESMDRRADLQLRLQETVEGLSVVAISYYAVSLAAYLGYPLAGIIGLSKGELTAALVIPVLLAVWVMVRRIRRHAGK